MTEEACTAEHLRSNITISKSIDYDCSKFLKKIKNLPNSALTPGASPEFRFGWEEHSAKNYSTKLLKKLYKIRTKIEKFFQKLFQKNIKQNLKCFDNLKFFFKFKIISRK